MENSTAKPHSKGFTNEAIRAIWDGFTEKDMSYEQFAQELSALSDPQKMMSDLQDIELKKARQRSHQARIDKALKGR